MNKKAQEFLKTLLAIPTPSGAEGAGQDVVADYLKPYADTVETDVHGNLHAVVNPSASLRVMLAGHCDEIGLMVQHIDEKGFLYMSRIGGVNIPLLQGERLIIQGPKGPVPGVIGVKPIHLMTEKEREGGVKHLHELWVDIGARNRKDAEKAVEPGNTATIDTGWIELRNGLIACRGMDDRIGAFVVADTLRLIRSAKLNVAVHVVSTVQEEVGLRGARTAAFRIDPQIGIAVDVAHATDVPGIEEKSLGRVKLGDGPVLHPGPTYNPKLLELLKKAARHANVKFQIRPDAQGMSTDAYAMQMTRGGVAAALVSIPNRYMHSPVETIALEDVEKAVRLLARFLTDLTSRETCLR